MRYSIEDTTLTGIANALRRKHGETKTITVTETQQFPKKYIVKTPNATGFGTNDFEGIYTEGLEITNVYGSDMYIQTLHLPNAAKIKIKISWDLAYKEGDNMFDEFFICEGQGYLPFDSVLDTFKKGNQKEYEVSGEYVSFVIYPKTSSITDVDRNLLGYYAEVTGYDASGNPLEPYEAEVEVDKAIPNTFDPLDMADAIDELNIPPESAYEITGDVGYMFYNGSWDWFLEQFKDKITSKDMKAPLKVFMNSTVTSIPFDLNFNTPVATSYSGMFDGCKYLKEISGKLVNIHSDDISSMFNNCYLLRYLPEFENLDMNSMYEDKYGSMSKMFSNCYSLRNIPAELLNKLYNPLITSGSYALTNSGFLNCYVLDEIKGLKPITGTITSNIFSSCFTGCSRAKNITFALQEDGTPYSANWKTQTIDLTARVGYGLKYNFMDYNSGITEDKNVENDEDYQALKDDPDWFTVYFNYSRYNHDSAVNTINSLPDTSAYLATAGGTNTIKFLGEAGSLTDGGAINTLTEEEIAVATAKGWTVTFA